MDYETILKELKKERMKQRISLREIGKKMGVSGQQIHFFESGHTSLKLKDYLTLCDILGVSPRRFIGGEQTFNEEEQLAERLLNLSKRDMEMVYILLEFLEGQR